MGKLFIFKLAFKIVLIFKKICTNPVSINSKREICFCYRYFVLPQVNHLGLNTDYALRTGAFDPSNSPSDDLLTADNDTLKEKALQRYTQAKVQCLCMSPWFKV